MKKIILSFGVSDQNAMALKNFISEYKTLPQYKQEFVLGIIKKSLFDLDSTEVISDERMRELIEITRLEYLILGLERRVNNFKFKVEGK